MRRALSIIGLLGLAAAWLGPLPTLAAGSFAAHMCIHMMVVAVASPLLAIGLMGSRLDPAVRWPDVFAAIPASLVELAVVWLWHAPALHHAARHVTGLFVAEQASFLVAGLYLWRSVLVDAEMRPRAAGNGIIALLLTFAHMTLLGALLALTPRALYHSANLASQPSALADRQIGGAIMLAVGAVSYISGGLWLGRNLLRNQPLLRVRA